MDARSLEVLEFPAVLAMLAEDAAFEGGRALALELEPASDPRGWRAGRR